MQALLQPVTFNTLAGLSLFFLEYLNLKRCRKLVILRFDVRLIGGSCGFKSRL